MFHARWFKRFAAALALLTASASFAQSDAGQVERLEGACRLWGVVRYFHPTLATETVDWDKALVDAIPAIEAAQTPKAYREAIDLLLSALHDPVTKAVDPNPSATSTDKPSGPPALSWLEEPEGKVAVISARDWAAIAAKATWPAGNVLTPLLKQCEPAAAIILDLRRTSRALPGGLDGDAFVFAQMFSADARGLTAHDLKLPSGRTRMHSGYPPQDGRSSGGYYSGFQVQEHTLLKAVPTPAAGKPIVILTNPISRAIPDVLAALQIGGVATVIHEGDASETFLAVDSYVVKLPMGVSARVRTEDLICPDGSIDFEPAIVVGAGAEGSDPAMERARAILSGADKAPIASPRPIVPAVQRMDKPYADMSYPSREYRLLALFRLWNVMHYFFPYKQHMDAPWDSVLAEFIPKFAAAKNAAEYGLAIREITARLQDTHVGVRDGKASAESRDALGGFVPPLLVRTIEGRPVVRKILNDAADVHAGDSILEIDGVKTDSVRDKFSRYVSTSTPQSMRRRIDPLILRGQKDSVAQITVQGLDGTSRTVELKRSMGVDDVNKAAAASPEIFGHPAHEVFCVLPSGFGYFDLPALMPEQVGPAFEKVKDTPALIMDMRGYPNGTAWEICSRLTESRMIMAKFTRPFWTSPRPEEHTSFEFDQPIEPGRTGKYKGRIVVLINEAAVSQSEHSCMGFESAAKGRITFIGSPTTGANGDVSNCVLPGGVYVSFSGHDVRHADGRQLQRIGIQPDIKIEPTIQGLIDGKDEVLDAAIEFLQGKK